MSLPPTPTADSWSAEILETAKEFFNGSISIVEPSTPGQRNKQTGVIGSGTPGAVVIGPRPARLQHTLKEIARADGNGVTVVHSLIAQMEIQPGDPLITQGLILKVHDGGRDPSLTEYTFYVYSGIGSSHAALRTIRAKTEIPS